MYVKNYLSYSEQPQPAALFLWVQHVKDHVLSKAHFLPLFFIS